MGRPSGARMLCGETGGGPEGEVVMEELVKLVAERAGITPQQAQVAVQTCYEYVKGKVPPALLPQLEAMASGKAGAEVDPLSLLGGLFGRK